MTREITIKCKKCGNELPAGATFCDKCGEPVSKNRKKAAKTKSSTAASKGKRKVFVIAAIILLAVIYVSTITNNRPAMREKPADESYETFDVRLSAIKSRVSPELYEQLDFGMSYEEVVALIGEEGAKEYGNTYVWPGEYFDMTEQVYNAPRIKLGFGHSMKLINIEEHGVLCGDEIYKNNSSEQNEVVLTADQLASMKGRMSYREIADIIGAEGVLTQAESEKNGSERKTYEWRYQLDCEKNPYTKLLRINFYNDKAERNDWDEWGE